MCRVRATAGRKADAAADSAVRTFSKAADATVIGLEDPPARHAEFGQGASRKYVH